MPSLRISLFLLTGILISSCKTQHKGFGGASSYAPYVHTITVMDTQLVTEVRSFDTIVSIQSRDTIYIFDTETQVQVEVIKLPGDSIFVRPICPSDTVVVERYKIESVEQRLVEAVGVKWKKELLLGAIIVLGLFAVGYTIKAFKS